MRFSWSNSQFTKLPFSPLYPLFPAIFFSLSAAASFLFGWTTHIKTFPFKYFSHLVAHVIVDAVVAVLFFWDSINAIFITLCSIEIEDSFIGALYGCSFCACVRLRFDGWCTNQSRRSREKTGHKYTQPSNFKLKNCPACDFFPPPSLSLSLSCSVRAQFIDLTVFFFLPSSWAVLLDFFSFSNTRNQIGGEYVSENGQPQILIYQSIWLAAI